MFSPKECVNAINNIDKEFHAGQSGGRIIDFDQNHILLTVGDYKNRYLAQKKDSVFGKIIKIDIIFKMDIFSDPNCFYLARTQAVLPCDSGGPAIDILHIHAYAKSASFSIILIHPDPNMAGRTMPLCSPFIPLFNECRVGAVIPILLHPLVSEANPGYLVCLGQCTFKLLRFEPKLVSE